jgi:hypothetical protein
MLVFAFNGVESITSISAQLGKEQRPGQGVARLHRFAGVIINFEMILNVHISICVICTLFSLVHMSFCIPCWLGKDLFVVIKRCSM